MAPKADSQMYDPSLEIKHIKGVGPKRAALLNSRLNIFTIMDAAFHMPFRYADRGEHVSFSELKPGEVQTVSGYIAEAVVKDLKNHGRPVTDAKKFRNRRGLLFELTLSDGESYIKGKWFQQPYMASRLKKGMTITMSGKVKYPKYGAIYEMDSPEHEILTEDKPSATDESNDSPPVTPVYGTTEDLTPRQLKAIIHSALESVEHFEDYMPASILSDLSFPSLDESIRAVHFPPEGVQAEEFNDFKTKWQLRLAFDDLFMLEAGFAVIKRNKQQLKGRVFAPAGNLFAKLKEALPFTLTSAQERVINEILSDMRRPLPMHRLLQGDVGAGKTLVALAAMLTAVESGTQCAIMAPTEILAEQHYINIHALVESLGLSICLITGSRKDRPLADIASGNMDIVVGTHALIEDDVQFKDLGLAVIDEQHRFGVAQRAKLRRKSINPDVLIMTATPIPRTLALTLYGDLDYSVLDELPPGRIPVETRLYVVDGEKDMLRLYKTLSDEVKSGGQAYVVYPLVEETEKSDLKSATEALDSIVANLPDLRVALLHGRVKPAEKEQVMRGFKDGKIDILVSTTVIEVGVDVPNASLMLIENAERFGLSQLHQLRGRVGRGQRASRCVLLASPRIGEDSRRRLEVMCRTTDGFEIAQEDLEIRGPGEVLGTRQSGVPDMKVANIVRDAKLFEPARSAAFELLARDPQLKEHPALKGALEIFWQGKIELFRTG